MNEKRLSLLKGFSHRLVATLKENGMESPNAQSGVKVANLSKVANCSNQMARQYVQGESLPEPHAIQQIADWLDIDPGYLLFGTQNDEYNTNIPKKELVNISYEMLETILNSCIELFEYQKDKDRVVSFLLDITYDNSALGTDRIATHKAIKSSISSVKKLSKVSPLKNTD